MNVEKLNNFSLISRYIEIKNIKSIFYSVILKMSKNFLSSLMIFQPSNFLLINFNTVSSNI